MNYHMVLTRRCNLNCHYCHGGEEAGDKTEIEYSLDDLERFITQDPDPQLMFYGGEPTLRPELMMQMMDRFPKARFMLQTNGLLLHRIPFDYVKRIHSILISIDGRENVTDFYRSKGVYAKVINNVRWLRENRYRGDVVARMAVSEESDIFKEVMHLIDLKNPSFNHVHWQLNVVWDADGNWKNFDQWVDKRYKPGVTRLVDEWLARMEEGVVEGIVPFIPIMQSILQGEPSHLRCGSGLDTFAIHVDGSIGVCPISPDWDFSIVGDILHTEPAELKDIMHVDEPCVSCDVADLCGGRCLFANKQRLWGEEGFEKVCGTVKHLIGELQRIAPAIQSLITAGIVDQNEFRYPEYNNGCEIIP